MNSPPAEVFGSLATASRRRRPTMPKADDAVGGGFIRFQRRTRTRLFGSCLLTQRRKRCIRGSSRRRSSELNSSCNCALENSGVDLAVARRANPDRGRRFAVFEFRARREMMFRQFLHVAFAQSTSHTRLFCQSLATDKCREHGCFQILIRVYLCPKFSPRCEKWPPPICRDGGARRLTRQ